jgi:putative DNA primase/helicase
MVYLTHGELAGVVRESAQILQQAGAGMYQYGDRLVRLVTVDACAPGDPIRRDPALQVLRPVVAGWIALRLSDAAGWSRWDVRAGTWRPTDPPPRVAAMILDAGDELGFDVLRARAACPQLLPDGRIQGHGYHADTGLLVDAPGDWPAPPERPTPEDARQALGRLRELLRFYSWATPAAEAAALAALVTGCIRATLPSAPLFAISAPLSGAGSGKSLLARAISSVSTGRSPTTITWPATPGEGAKRLDATHLAGDLMVTIDNISGALDDDALCTALTEPSRDIRELGSSRIARTPMVALHTATGNALTIRGDLTRRTIMIELDPRTDTPDQRLIPQDLLGECRARRGEIVRDVHTILRAYRAAGCPDMGLRPMGEYREWTRRVRSPLVWLGLPDPAATQQALRADDPQREARVALFQAWHRAFGGGPADGASAREAVDLIAAGSQPYTHLPDETLEQLREAIEAVALRRGKLDTTALGRWLRSARDARVGPLVMTGRAGKGGRMRWAVVHDGGEGRDSECDTPAASGGDGRDSRYNPHYLRENCQVKTDRYRDTSSNDPDHADHPDPIGSRLAEAVAGLDLTVAELRAELTADDLADIANGRTNIEALRIFAAGLEQGGSSR